MGCTLPHHNQNESTLQYLLLKLFVLSQEWFVHVFDYTDLQLTQAATVEVGDYCDGSQFQQHPLFQKDLCALQEILWDRNFLNFTNTGF